MPCYEGAFRRWFWALEFHHRLLGTGRFATVTQVAVGMIGKLYWVDRNVFYNRVERTLLSAPHKQ